jgi:hypothetical protein
MSTTPTFGTPILGQTEKALNAILDRQLAGTGLTEPQWVTLTLTIAGGGTVDHDQLVGRVAGVLKVSEAEAQARISAGQARRGRPHTRARRARRGRDSRAFAARC